MQIGPKGAALYWNEMNLILIKSQRLQVLTIYPVNTLNCQASLPPVFTLPGNIWKSDIRSLLDHQTAFSNSIISLYISRNAECLVLWEPIFLGGTECGIKRQCWHCILKVTWKARRGDRGNFLSVGKEEGMEMEDDSVSKYLDLTPARELDFMTLSKGIIKTSKLPCFSPSPRLSSFLTSFVVVVVFVLLTMTQTWSLFLFFDHDPNMCGPGSF